MIVNQPPIHSSLYPHDILAAHDISTNRLLQLSPFLNGVDPVSSGTGVPDRHRRDKKRQDRRGRKTQTRRLRLRPNSRDPGPSLPSAYDHAPLAYQRTGRKKERKIKFEGRESRVRFDGFYHLFPYGFRDKLKARERERHGGCLRLIWCQSCFRGR